MNKKSIIVIVLLLGLFLGLAPTVMAATGPAHTNQNTLLVSKAVEGDLATVEAGAEFTYVINYAYASTTEDGRHVTLVDYLDPDLSWNASQVIIGTTPHIAGTSYEAATGKVTWTFIDPLPAGSSGQVTLRVRFPLGSTPNGAVATNTATLTADNAPSATSNEVSITATAACRWVANVVGPSTAVLDQNVTYTARLDRPNPATGNLNAIGGTVVLTLPVGVWPDDIVNTNGGVIAGTGVTDDPVTVTWSGVTANANGSAGSAAWSRNLVLRYDATRFGAGQVVTVHEAMTVTVLGGDTCSGTDGQNTTLSTFTPNPNGSAGKGVSDSTVLLHSQTFYFTLDADSTGNVGLDNYTIDDALPSNFALSAVRLPTVSNGPGGNFITLVYRRSDTDATEYTWPGSPFAASGALLAVSDLGLPSGVYISHLRFVFGSVAANFAIANAIQLHGTLISPGWGPEGREVKPGDTVCNTMTFTADYGGAPAFTRTATRCVTVSLPTVRPAVTKSVIAGSSVVPGQTTTWQIELLNSNSSDIPMVNPMGMELLPAALEYVPGSFTPRTDGSYNSSGAPAPTLVVIDNYNGTGRTLLRWTYTHSFPINTRATVQFQTRVKPGTAAGSITNRGYIAVDDSLQAGVVVYASSTTDNTDLDGDGSRTDPIGQSSSVSITVRTSAALNSYKLVKGQLDTEWSRYPASGLTSPGGIADYRLIVENVGNVPLTQIVIVDILPAIGDTGVVVTQSRQSEWTPFLAGPVSAPAGVTVYYSTESNPRRDEMGDPDPFPAGANPPNWSTVPPTDITTVRSLRFDFGQIRLAGGDRLELRWPMRVPVDAPTNGEVAWNSFGVVATRSDTMATLLPTEPIKVGIAVEPIRPAAYGNLVWEDGNGNGIQDDGEPGLDGVRVELYRDNGDGVADPTVDAFVGFTLSSGGGQYLFSNLPPGDYFAVFFKPPTYLIAPADQGGNEEADSDGTPATVRGLAAAMTAVTTLISGEIDLSWDQGFYHDLVEACAAVGNYVWFDENGNGLQDEPAANGLNGVLVKLFDGSGHLIATTTTANDVNGNPGYYLFDTLIAGNYFLQFVPPSDFELTSRGPTGLPDPEDSDPDPVTGLTEVFYLAPGYYDPTWDAGIRLPIGPLSLGDRVWIDTNGNGLYEPEWGETGIEGVRLNLYRDANGNGIFDPGIDTFFKTTTTFTAAGEPGYYRFTDLPAGDFIVQIPPENFGAGGPLEGYSSTSGNGVAPDPDDDRDRDDNGEPGDGYGVVSRAITLTVNGEPTTDGDTDPNTNLTLDFGFIRPATVGDRVWRDANSNGIQDAGEPGLDGVTVRLYRPGYGPDGLPGTGDDANPVATTVTVNGLYGFDHLHPGTYVVEVIPPVGYLFSPANQGGDDSLDSDADPSTGRTAAFLLGSGQDDRTRDAGLYEPRGTIGDYVWNDANGNGLQDEPPGAALAGVGLRLYADDGDAVFEPGGDDTLVATTATAADGTYRFDNLPPGSYWVDVDESTLTGFTLIPGSQSGPEPHRVVLGPNQAYDEADFGYAGRGSISGVVFFDWDQNGVQGLGEAGIPGVEVCLYVDTDDDGLIDPGSLPVECVSTQPDGSYVFSGYLPGNYLVVQTPIPGFENTTPLVRDVTLIVIGSSGTAPNNDFGNVAFGSIGDFIYLDSNGNGAQDPGETTGVAGVLVTVTNLDTGQVFTTTSAGGFYLVEGLIPGTYRVEVPATVPGLVRTSPSPLIVTLGLNEDYLQADFGYIAPTAVQLSTFTAVQEGGAVVVRWATVAEQDQEGFRVWRGTAVEGPYVPVSGLIPAANSPTGARYEWVDRSVVAGVSYWYKLESVPDGQWFGPVGVGQEEGLRRLFLPLVRQRR